MDVDVHFGPFTCIAGPNGVGKSNLFDAILLLNALTERTLTEAALSVRDESKRTGDVRSVFHRIGGSYDSEISLSQAMQRLAELIDDFSPLHRLPTFAAVETDVRAVIRNAGWSISNQATPAGP